MVAKYKLINFSKTISDSDIKNSLIAKPFDVTPREWLTHPLNPYPLNNTSVAILNLIEIEGQKHQRGTFLTQQTISNKLNISVSTLRYHLRMLEALNIIQTTIATRFVPGSASRKGMNRHKINPLYASLQGKNYWQVFTNEPPQIVSITCKHERNSYLKNIASSTETSKLNISINICQAKKLKKNIKKNTA